MTLNHVPLEQRFKHIESAFSPIAKRLGFLQVEREIGQTGSAYASYKSDHITLRLIIDRGDEGFDVAWTDMSRHHFDLSLVINAIRKLPGNVMFSFEEQLNFLNTDFAEALQRANRDLKAFEKELLRLAARRRGIEPIAG